MALHFGLQPKGEFAAPGWLATVNWVCFMAALAFFSTRQIHALGQPANDQIA